MLTASHSQAAPSREKAMASSAVSSEMAPPMHQRLMVVAPGFAGAAAFASTVVMASVSSAGR
ncbi:hypothetical protein [Streptomyces sp. NPDC005349]|uniref:hypothetical protein n=1 Tax=unclassified Streptomyces TaxID=2593676 RepID=UPI0033B8A14C